MIQIFPLRLRFKVSRLVLWQKRFFNIKHQIFRIRSFFKSEGSKSIISLYFLYFLLIIYSAHHKFYMLQIHVRIYFYSSSFYPITYWLMNVLHTSHFTKFFFKTITFQKIIKINWVWLFVCLYEIFDMRFLLQINLFKNILKNNFKLNTQSKFPKYTMEKYNTWCDRNDRCIKINDFFRIRIKYYIFPRILLFTYLKKYYIARRRSDVDSF